MNNIFNKIIKEAKTLNLTKKEKDLILTKVTSFIKDNPLNTDRVISPYSKDIMARPVATNMWYNNLGSGLLVSLSKLRSNKYIPLVVMLMLILGAGTSLAASHSLPGDLLYPIKIHINEKVESMFAFGANANAKVEAEQATNRLKEVEKLSLKGPISVKAKDEIQANFKEHADNVDKLVADIKAKGDKNTADSLNSEFESSLQVHHLLLTEIAKNDEKDKVKINEINSDISTHIDGSTEQKNPSQGDTNKEPIKNNENLNLDINAGTQVDVSHDSNNTNGAANTNNSVHLGL